MKAKQAKSTVNSIACTSKQIHRKRKTIKILIIGCKLKILTTAMKCVGRHRKMCGSLKSSCLVTLDHCPRTSETSHLTSDSSLVMLHFFFFFFWEMCFKRGITYLLVAHVKRINVRKNSVCCLCILRLPIFGILP